MAAPPPTYTILGKGTYGAVVLPALPNIDSSGNPVIFGDDMVTKIMFMADEYKEAKQANANIRARVESLAIPMYDYRRKYMVYNIENKVPALKAEIDTRRHTSSMDGVYLIRMPNLGYSLQDIQNHAALSNLFRALPNEVILGEIVKLAHTVRDIRNAGFIHGDIRETNVLCDPATGRMAIIDFDWFMARDKYIATYPTYFYAHPPEELLLLKRESKFATQFVDRFPIEDHELVYKISGFLGNKLAARASTTVYVLGGKVNPHLVTEQHLEEGVLLAVLQLRRQAEEVGAKRAIDMMKEKLLNTVDSYGLGIALYRFIDKTLTLPHQADLREMLLVGLGGLLHPNMYERMTIDAFITHITPKASRSSSANAPRLRQTVGTYAILPPSPPSMGSMSSARTAESSPLPPLPPRASTRRTSSSRRSSLAKRRATQKAENSRSRV